MSKDNQLHQEKNIWLHLGASAFFRAHQAYYLNQLNQLEKTPWEMHLANLRNSASQDTLKILKKQQGQYHLEIISPEGNIEYEKIDILKKIILWDEKLKSTILAGSSAATKIISFTVTEGGYFLKDDGSLDLNHPAVHSDLTTDTEIQTIYGALAQILTQRMLNNTGAITLLCCDNLRNNGQSFARGLNDFIHAKKLDTLATWIQKHVTTPNSMVDRITPKFDSKIFDRMHQYQLNDDLAPLSCEKFTRWAIEDHFATIRPALEKVGVEFVDNVSPIEEAKIRLLNASHSGLSWAGALTHKTLINETLTQNIVGLIQDYANNEVKFALQSHNIHIDTAKECNSILTRFKNPYVKDTVARVSSDSIAKLNGFIVPTLKDCFAQGIIPHNGLKLAGLYFLFLEKYNSNQLSFTYEDRAFSQVNLKQIFTHEDPIESFSSSPDLFGSLSENASFKIHLRQAIKILTRQFR